MTGRRKSPETPHKLCLRDSLEPTLEDIMQAWRALERLDTQGRFEPIGSTLLLAREELDFLSGQTAARLDFVTHLKSVISHNQGLGLQVSLQNFCAGIDLTDDQARHCLYVLKEAFANAVKHGKSARIAVVIMQDDAAFKLSVSDQGKGTCGIQSNSDGIGMNGMKQRASALGGELHHHKNSLGGTTLEMMFPLHNSPDKAADSVSLQPLGQALHDGYCQCLVGCHLALEAGMESLLENENEIWKKAKLLQTTVQRHLEETRQLSHRLSAHKEGSPPPSLEG